ncbi:MAG: hypothetical protein HC828_10805 [Blastochloris sp.]|nr:hypothetical protein [Blastochloris sp.]
MRWRTGRGRGYGFLMMESADDTVCIAIEGQSELLEAPPGGMDAFYEGMVYKHVPVTRRLAHAERVTPVKGMKRIGNLYRQAGGPGWALVGDAYHQKDPIDGQGIYDAIFTAKVLAQTVVAWKHGEVSWEQAVAQYDHHAREETFAQYHATLSRVRASIYTNTPTWIRPLARYILEDSLCQERLGLMLTRQVDPNNPISAPILIGALLRGPLRDLSRALDRQLERV